MSAFLTKLVFTTEDGGLPFTLIEPLVYQSDLDGLITVPAGYRTDLASVPRALWSLIPPFGRYSGPAVVHDRLCDQGHATRPLADAVFNEAMIVTGVPAALRWLMYTAVRIAGQSTWERYRARDAALARGARYVESGQRPWLARIVTVEKGEQL